MNGMMSAAAEAITNHPKVGVAASVVMGAAPQTTNWLDSLPGMVGHGITILSLVSVIVIITTNIKRSKMEDEKHEEWKLSKDRKAEEHDLKMRIMQKQLEAKDKD